MIVYLSMDFIHQTAPLECYFPLELFANGLYVEYTIKQIIQFSHLLTGFVGVYLY